MTSVSRRHVLRLVPAAAMLPYAGAQASVSTGGYPTQSVSVIVPFGAGSSTDYMARLMTNGLNARYPGRFIVDNKPGAGASIGTAHVGKSRPDGSVLLYTTATPFVINPFIYKKLPYEPREFIPAARTVELALVLVVSASLGVRNFAELRRYLERNSKAASYSSYGAGTSSHIAGAVLARKLDLPELLHVPYKDTKAIPDLVAGRNTFHMEAWSSVKPLVKAGQLVAIAVTSAHPVKWAPELPTIASAIGTEYDVATWHGIFAPAKTPRNIIDFLNDEFRLRMESAEPRQACLDMGFNPYPHMTAEQFSAFVKSDATRWHGYVKEAGIQPE
ncbi:tripartite tricarboxylate transporter substrate binding protein [Variovorax sp. NFACC27]|uniref:Bug family tripartite tricarboxylate transporter substrate binding protein n=1 Tax=unclassified Variovorax TaxID=663243 RepID=UPI00115FD800